MLDCDVIQSRSTPRAPTELEHVASSAHRNPLAQKPTARVWKFNLKPHDNRVEMPCGAKLLSVAFQGNDLKLWAHIGDGRTPEIRIVRVVGTGHEVDADGRFVGTAFHPIGLVFHVFDCGSK